MPRKRNLNGAETAHTKYGVFIMIIPGMPLPAISKIPTTLTYIGNAYAQVGTYTLYANNLSFPNPDPNRYLIVCAAFFVTDSGNQFEDLTANNTTMNVVSNKIVVFNGIDEGSVIYSLAMPTGTSVDLSFNVSSSSSKDGAFAIYSLITSDPTAHDTDSEWLSGIGGQLSLDVPAGGVGLFMGNSASSNGAEAGTPTNFTEDFEFDYRSDEWFVGGRTNWSGTRTMSHSGQMSVFGASWA